MKGLSSYELRQLILSVGTRKSVRPLSPVEVGNLIQRALDAGETRTAIAARLYLDDSNTIIGRFIRLLSLPREVQHLVGWGSDPSTLSFTSAAMIARLKSAEEHRTLAKAALEQQFSKSEIIQVVQIRQRSSAAMKDCIKAVLDQRPVIEKRHVIIGELRSEKLKETLKQISQFDRNRLIESALERNISGISHLGCKLGDAYFFLVGDDQLHDEILSLPDGFESSITEYLEQELRNKD